jgi:hypothetical protein
MRSTAATNLDSMAVLLVPDCLGQGTRAIEILFHKITELPQASRYVFDMAAVKFIEPCGVIALFSAVRHCASKSARRVLMTNLNEHLYPYLERMNLFEIAGIWLEPITALDEAWNRNANTISLLELTPVTTYEDVTSALERARGIFTPWLSQNELFNLLRVVSELCQNIYQHSGDAHGCVLIQKYQSDQNQVSICLAVGDSGCGIRANLVKRYPWLGNDPVDFVRAAMDGNYTSRVTKRGGLGLRTVRDIAAAHGGYVSVRSENASVTDWGKGEVGHCANLSYIAGTQVSVRLRSSC